MFTKRLTDLFKDKNLPIITHAVHPGVVNTDLFKNSFVKYLKLIKDAVFKVGIFIII